MARSRILVSVSRTDTLEQPAVQRAMSLQDGAELELFRCVYDPNLESYPLMPREEDYFDVRDALVQEAAEGLRDMVDTLRERGQAVNATVAWDYPVYQGIIRRAVAANADVVVTESLRTPPARGFASADWYLVSGCPVPLLLVESNGKKTYRHIAAAVDPFHARAKPAALDEVILSRADELARTFDARLSAVYCLAPLEDIARLEREGKRWSPQADERLMTTVRKAIEELLGKQGIDPDVAQILRGPPGFELPMFVEREKVDVLVMGALSRAALADLVIGTTAAEVLGKVDCDLLIVKPPGFLDTVSQHIRLEPATEPLFYPF